MEENTMVNTNNAVNAVKPVKEHRISTGGAVGIVSGVGAICAAIGWFGRMLWDKNKGSPRGEEGHQEAGIQGSAR